jgi:uncharacterized protein (TIGR03085 family)
MSIAQRERAALAQTLREVGPDAPTLCDGWTARDLTAHLVLREYRPDAAPGIVVPFLARYTAVAQKHIARSDWDRLLNRLATGPPFYSPLKLLDSVVNVAEMFVHHEDVRRAVPGWVPRDIHPAAQAALRRPIPMFARMSMARLPARVSLNTPDGLTLASVGRGPGLAITGEPLELLLFAFGRNEVSAEFSGDDDTVAAVKAARRGI